MTPTLRPYQQEAVDATLRYFRTHRSPALIVLPTGAGKSLVIAELARLAKGRVMVLAHVKELVEQNFQKFRAADIRAEIFSAGLQRYETTGKVIFGSVQSVARHLARFSEPFSLLIIDECHRISEDTASQYQQIIHALQQKNPSLRLLGLTATPYRLDTGWIYQYHYHGMRRTAEPTFFRDCIYELPLRYLIRQGYLVAPKRLDMPVVNYDFSALLPGPRGVYSENDLNRALKTQTRLTPLIVRQIIDISETRQGTMIFAATKKHAQEVCALLPAGSAALITAETPAAQRAALIAAFKAQQLRYLVNVAVLTTGFDAPHVDTIAILRPTESVSLYQQIVGRGLRLSPGKTECLILDYAGNPHDLFAPEPGGRPPAPDTEPVQVFCPACGFANLFWGRRGADGTVLEHFGRRCQGWQPGPDGERIDCDYRFRFRLCPQCDAENDIAARQCHQCAATLLDPDDQLKAALRLKDHCVIRCAGMSLHPGKDAHGEWLTVVYHDEDGMEIEERFRLHTPAQRQVFTLRFLKLHQKAPGEPWVWQQAADILRQQARLRHPDFVIASLQKQRWQIRQKIFDYQGRFRRADELRAR